MAAFLRIRLDAPLMSFGDVKVDQLGKTAEFPLLSQICGMLGNALGYDHKESRLLQGLQDRLMLASRIDANGELMTDYQTAQLQQDDEAWTTRGKMEGRAGGTSSYNGAHIRKRDYWQDRVVVTVVGLHPGEGPTVADLAAALQDPSRPLFIGRKPCLPAEPLFDGLVEADTIVQALFAGLPSGSERRVQWPGTEPVSKPLVVRGSVRRRIADLRDWAVDVHTGSRLVNEGAITHQEHAS